MTVKELHREAMEQYELSILAKKKDPSQAQEFLIKAFKLEKEATLKYLVGPIEEPTRTVLLRSAANLALLAGLKKEAKELALIGLQGTPPKSLVVELEEILMKVNESKLQTIRRFGPDNIKIRAKSSAKQLKPKRTNQT